MMSDLTFCFPKSPSHEGLGKQLDKFGQGLVSQIFLSTKLYGSQKKRRKLFFFGRVTNYVKPLKTSKFPFNRFGCIVFKKRIKQIFI